MFNTVKGLRGFTACAAACVWLLGIAVGARAAADADSAKWFVVQLEGQRVGSMRELERVDERGNVVSETLMTMTLKRGEAALEIKVETVQTETPGGEPIEARASLNMGGTPIVTSMRFEKEVTVVTSEQGGRSSTQTVPRGERAWMPPAALSRYVAEQLAQGAESLEVWSLDPLNGPVPFATTMKVVGRENVEVLGKTVPAVVWDASVSILPGVSMREYVDDRGQTLRATLSLMPGMTITIVEADEQLAKSPFEPAEVMAGTLIAPVGEAIDRPRSARFMRVLVRGAAAALPATPVQSVTAAADADVYEVVVDLDSEAEGEVLEDEARVGYLASSVLIDHEDEAVRALRDRALRTKMLREPYQDAELLRRFVYGFVETKDLSVGFASAGDVARTAQGDCTEHAVLLAALLRAQGIPSRCVSGLVYADAFLGKRDIFGYHLWTQAYLDPDGEHGPMKSRWVDLDPTLDAAVAFDATHVALRVASLDRASPMNDLMDLAPMLGRLEIEVLESR